MASTQKNASKLSAARFLSESAPPSGRGWNLWVVDSIIQKYSEVAARWQNQQFSTSDLVKRY